MDFGCGACSRPKAATRTRESPGPAASRGSSTRTARWSSRWTTPRFPPPGRRLPRTSSSRSTSARPACPGWTPTAIRCWTRKATRCWGRNVPPRTSSTGSPKPGGTGARATATSKAPPTPRPSRTRSSTCSPTRWRRPTARSGSTPACRTSTASPVRRRGSGTWTRRPARYSPPPTPTPGRRPMPASSSRWPTTSSTRAGSWICGSGRPVSSRWDPAPAPTSPTSGPRASRWRAAGKARGSCRSSRSETGRRGRSSPAAPPGGPPRWSSSTPTTPTSRISSPGSATRNRRPAS